ncbi:hypothetical protein [Xenorhabdus entomophaga]|uniref:hypothetical protein n=1 Tax=Xenorhabdus entomophaga TaxID=3136257 RepID=UPI0030F455EB
MKTVSLRVVSHLLVRTHRDEVFIYDERNRLTNYTCTGSALPVDAYGNEIRALDFTLDIYSNITDCVTTLGGGNTIDTTKYWFDNPDDPCQLTSVAHSLTSHYPANIVLAYDNNGRMTTDETGRTLTYDEAGRLSSISGSDGNSLYGYDALDQLVMQSLNSTETRELYYHGNRLANEVSVEQNQFTRFIPGAWSTSAVSDESLN